MGRLALNPALIRCTEERKHYSYFYGCTFTIRIIKIDRNAQWFLCKSLCILEYFSERNTFPIYNLYIFSMWNRPFYGVHPVPHFTPKFNKTYKGETCALCRTKNLQKLVIEIVHVKHAAINWSNTIFHTWECLFSSITCHYQTVFVFEKR